MERKPDFKRLKTVILLQGEPDYVPIFEFGIADNIMSAYMGKEIHNPGRIGISRPPLSERKKTEYLPGYIDFFKTAGYDFVPITFSTGTQILSALESGELDNISDFKELRKSKKNGEWIFETKGIINSWKDFEIFPWPKIGSLDLNIFNITAKLLPKGMKIIAHAGGMLSHVRNFMGMNNFWITLNDDLDLVVTFLQKMQNIELAAIDKATDNTSIGAFLMDDDLACKNGLLENPFFLKKYIFTFYKKVAELVHSKDIPIILHSDGNILGILSDLIECGIDAIQPIEPQTMSIEEIKKHFGGKIALIGNIDINILAKGTPKEVRSEVYKLIQKIAPGGGYAVGSGNTITSYVNISNYRAMVEAAFDFGQYPIMQNNTS